MQRLQGWIRQPSIAAENRGVTQGCDLTMRMLRDVGKVVMGRAAVNQKGPQSAFLAALHAIRAAGRKIPVNKDWSAVTPGPEA